MHHNKGGCNTGGNTDKNESGGFNTDSLDDAMKEFLDICQLYKDKVSTKSNGVKQPQIKASLLDKNNCHSHETKIKDQKMDSEIVKTNCDINNKQVTHQITTNGSNTDSIERLQKMQCDIQKQLDQVSRVAEGLAAKQRRRKFKSIIEDVNDEANGSSRREDQEDEIKNVDDDNDDDDDELIEFQQIENELRISELNRQLSDIQEEIRIRLYKRLLTNTTNGPGSVHNRPQNEDTNSLIRRNSNEEASPSSSSCSEGLQTTSTSSIDAEVITGARDEIDGHVLSRDAPSFRRVVPGRSNHHEPKSSENDKELPNIFNDKTNPQANKMATAIDNNGPNLDQIFDKIIAECEVIAPGIRGEESISNSSKSSASVESAPVVHDTVQSDNSNFYANSSNNNNTIMPNFCQSHRNNSANSDLERIEEAEEDDPDYYGDSEHFRTIYEEKLSPIIQSSYRDRVKYPLSAYSRNYSTQLDSANLTGQGARDEQALNEAADSKEDCSVFTSSEVVSNDNSGSGGGSSNNNSFNSSGVNIAKRSNRPLTLYLPKPDEQIDLVEHIQALGHDVDSISSDLKLSTDCAHGYLWKCCSNNSKKWLKRYFYFNRSSKVLSYYDTESHLVKRNSAPKNSIPFEEISDVYVDHKLSGSGERIRRGKNYVFVLATIGRKYLLASARAETMRAWIDILFTAAKSNDYFQQLDDIEDDNFVYQESDNNNQEA